jgi:hypothetical protein
VWPLSGCTPAGRRAPPTKRKAQESERDERHAHMGTGGPKRKARAQRESSNLPPPCCCCCCCCAAPRESEDRVQEVQCVAASSRCKENHSRRLGLSVGCNRKGKRPVNEEPYRERKDANRGKFPVPSFGFKSIRRGRRSERLPRGVRRCFRAVQPLEHRLIGCERAFAKE